ncbi:MAG: hypothetical protein ABH834_07970 [Candidatus Altiarchaeota archaeon]
MFSRGQGAIEWLMTHAWSIIVVLSVSAVLFYAGVFEATARPRFEGLASSSIQPIPDKIQLYSDGVMVFTVLNTRPYSVEFEWLEVAPIADRDDIVRTTLNVVLKQGELGVFYVNASNLLSVSAASLSFLQAASAENPAVSFHVCLHESYSAGGQQSSRTFCGKGYNIQASTEQSPFAPDCTISGECACGAILGECPLWCQTCFEGYCENYITCEGIFGPGYMCIPLVEHPGDVGCFNAV